eukprot:365243-Chlamydomonas_euryale.AAC.5
MPQSRTLNDPACSVCVCVRACRGFGTVRLASPAEAEAACQRLNNSKIEDRTISVRIDRFG